MTDGKMLEPVTVGAIFEPVSKLKPSWLVWKGRKIKIVRTNHYWTVREGLTTLYHFSVTDGVDTYHLVLNGTTQSWHLEGVQLPS